MVKEWLVFADESGIDAGHKCYSIGAMMLNHRQYELFQSAFETQKPVYKVIGEKGVDIAVGKSD